QALEQVAQLREVEERDEGRLFLGVVGVRKPIAEVEAPEREVRSEGKGEPSSEGDELLDPRSLVVARPARGGRDEARGEGGREENRVRPRQRRETRDRPGGRGDPAAPRLDAPAREGAGRAEEKGEQRILEAARGPDDEGGALGQERRGQGRDQSGLS